MSVCKNREDAENYLTKGFVEVLVGEAISVLFFCGECEVEG